MEFDETIIFYSICQLIQIFGASMYFLEIKNSYAQHHNRLAKERALESGTKHGLAARLSAVIESSKNAKWVLFHLLLTYLLTFSVFPGVTNSINFSFLNKSSLWYDISLVTTFNVCDTFGRYVGG